MKYRDFAKLWCSGFHLYFFYSEVSKVSFADIASFDFGKILRDSLWGAFENTTRKVFCLSYESSMCKTAIEHPRVRFSNPATEGSIQDAEYATFDNNRVGTEE